MNEQTKYILFMVTGFIVLIIVAVSVINVESDCDKAGGVRLRGAFFDAYECYEKASLKVIK